MKKSTIINQINQNISIAEKDIELIVNSMLNIITDSLKNGESVSLYGFGSFNLVKRKAKEIYIPGTTNKVKIPEKYAIKFIPSNRLKQEVESLEE